ncbi:MAG: alcohol dehydrogenase catalytic domain-containing protein [Defluviitaleaceae bacterium]|nr:alcohol dehydrogenase catalytic domain-containing protein [Defluviitaleaceae bacterium]
MKALMYTAPKTLELTKVPMPVPGEGEVLLKVMACAICGSDVHGWHGTNGRRTPPVVMGHELSARVEELGAGCAGLGVGDYVAVQPCLSCFECAVCKAGKTNICQDRRVMGVFSNNGGMQEYVVLPAKHCFPLPDGTDYRAGALAEPFAVSYSAVKKGGDLRGKNVLIVGGGTIGLMALLAAKLQEPRAVVLSDLSQARLAIAADLGADATINPAEGGFDEKLAAAFGGSKADVTVEAVGASATVNQAVSATAPGGTCIWIGNDKQMIDVNMQYIVTQEISVRGTYMFTHAEFGEAVALLPGLDLRVFIGNEVGLGEAADAFGKIAGDPDNNLKCIIDFAKQEGMSDV